MSMMPRRLVVVLTGGPGGGKSTLMEELKQDPSWEGRLLILPQAVQAMHSVNLSPREKLFQRVLVNLQMGLEDGLVRSLESEGPRLILCHRGSLDPLAFWRLRGWPENEFFQFTRTCRQDHYQRYAAVVHLVTAADDAAWAYKKWPEAHRPEEPEQAICLDNLLHEAWRGHPHYCRIANQGLDWPAKARQAREILDALFREI
jgi:predicted ATPase